MQIFRRATLPELMATEIEREAELFRRYCDELHEEFKERIQRRNEARATLPPLNEEVAKLQGVGVSLLRRLNAANQDGDEQKLQEFRKSYKKNVRQLDKAVRRRDRVAEALAASEHDEQDAARELAQDAADVVEDHAARVRELKERLEGLMKALDEHHEEVAQAAAPLEEEYERRRPDGETDEEAEGESSDEPPDEDEEMEKP